MEEDEEEQGGGEEGGHWELWLGTADWELCRNKRVQTTSDDEAAAGELDAGKHQQVALLLA